MRGRPVAAVAAVAALGLTGAALTSGPSRPSPSGRLPVVAAESFWGSIAAQLGGAHVRVTSIVSSPATDPHAYEPTAVDARALAGAKLVVVNGAGYDAWAPKLLAANPVSTRIVLTVGDLAHVAAGGNPHRWYSPTDVQRVADAITRAYTRLDPPHRRAYARAHAAFTRVALAGYRREIEAIRRRFAGVAVGASESIFAPLAQALGLRLVTPPGFLKAIGEGTEPTAGDLAAIGRQIAERRVAVWVYNSQNSTPDVQRLTRAAERRGIPVTTITETLSPEDATFEAWQVAQLRRLASALGRR